MRKHLIATMRLLATALFCGALFGCEKAATSKPGRGTSAPFIVEVLPIKAQPFRETLSATGSLLARESVQIQSERSGIVKEILFDEGQVAKAGDVLLTIDDSELQAQLARAKAQLDLATSSEARQRNLLKNQSVSTADFDQSRANLDIARAEVKLIEAQLAKTKVRAPFTGVAGLRNVSVGAYLTTGTTICTFQDVSSLKLDFSLPERYLGLVKPGLPVRFRIAGIADLAEAKIQAIEPTVDVQTRSLTIRAVLPNENNRLLPGSFAEVEVVLDEIRDAILIPSLALMPGLQQQTVFVHRGGVVEERKVQIGLRAAESVRVLSGLEIGDELIVSGTLQLRPGMKVQVKPVSQPPTANITAGSPLPAAP